VRPPTCTALGQAGWGKKPPLPSPPPEKSGLFALSIWCRGVGLRCMHLTLIGSTPSGVSVDQYPYLAQSNRDRGASADGTGAVAGPVIPRPPASR
jgi:hypothetical protein